MKVSSRVPGRGLKVADSAVGDQERSWRNSAQESADERGHGNTAFEAVFLVGADIDMIRSGSLNLSETSNLCFEPNMLTEAPNLDTTDSQPSILVLRN